MFVQAMFAGLAYVTAATIAFTFGCIHRCGIVDGAARWVIWIFVATAAAKFAAARLIKTKLEITMIGCVAPLIAAIGSAG